VHRDLQTSGAGTGTQTFAGHQAHFIKFTSFNILQFHPSVFRCAGNFSLPWPLDILASYDRDPPGLTQARPFRRFLTKVARNGTEPQAGFESPAAAVTAFFVAGLRAGKNSESI
jgi:hypothetical protein